MQTLITPATPNHLEGILKIVNNNILTSTAVYDYDVKTKDDIETWFSDKQNGGWPILVAEIDGYVAGYASYGTFRFKEGFKFTVEHSVYVAEGFAGKGIGYKLLSHLIAIAKEQKMHIMVGCIDAENAGSIAFHKKLGFTEAGILKQSGYKFNRWLDLMFMQLFLDQ